MISEILGLQCIYKCGNTNGPCTLAVWSSDLMYWLVLSKLNWNAGVQMALQGKNKVKTKSWINVYREEEIVTLCNEIPLLKNKLIARFLGLCICPSLLSLSACLSIFILHSLSPPISSVSVLSVLLSHFCVCLLSLLATDSVLLSSSSALCTFCFGLLSLFVADSLFWLTLLYIYIYIYIYITFLFLDFWLPKTGLKKQKRQVSFPGDVWW